MARLAKDFDLRTKTGRTKLAPRPKPYYTQIAPRKTLGYLRRADAAGSWQVREKVGGRFTYQTIGQADDLTRADGLDILSFEQALRKATDPNPAAPNSKMTVANALDAYLTKLAAKSKHAAEYRNAADKRIVPVLGSHRVDRVSKTQIEAWQAGMVRDDPEDEDARRRSQDTANRILTILKAALNHAFADDKNRIESDSAWRKVKPFKKVSRARDDDLDAGQVRAFIKAAATFDKPLANLIEAGFLTGARMGELAGLDVQHLDGAKRTLYLDGKTGQRTTTLTEEAAAFLQRLAGKRAPTDPLLPQGDGTRWPRSGHHRSIKRALALAKLPATVSFYTLRHAHISRAIDNGMPLSLIAENCGTSLLMIQRNYAKVLQKTRKAVFQKTAPKLRVVK